MATSSIPRPTISGSGTPTGIRSMLAPHLVVHAQDRGVRRGADDEARRDQHLVVLRLG